jgi:DNA modification methylase
VSINPSSKLIKQKEEKEKEKEKDNNSNKDNKDIKDNEENKEEKNKNSREKKHKKNEEEETKEENNNSKITFNPQHSTFNNYEKADLAITDPPYNVAYEKNKNFSMLLNDKMKGNEFYNFLHKAFKNYNNLILKEGSSIYVFHSDYERINFTKAFIDADLYFSQVLVWVKNHFILGRQDYHNKHEPIMYGWKKGKPHYFANLKNQSNIIENMINIKKLRKEELIDFIEKNITADKVETAVIHCDRPIINDLHPTMKPIKLLGKFIINSSKPNNLIVDLFGGSGSTMIASEQLDRRCYMMELEPKYCDVIIQRWQNLTKLEAIREDGKKFSEL